LKTAKRTGTVGRKEAMITSLIKNIQAKGRKRAPKNLIRKRFIYLMKKEMNMRKNSKEGMMK